MTYNLRFPVIVFAVVLMVGLNIESIADAVLPTTDEGIEQMLFVGFTSVFALFASAFAFFFIKEKREAKARAAAAAKAKAAEQAKLQAQPVKA